MIRAFTARGLFLTPLLLAVAAVTAACDSPTEPPPKYRVELFQRKLPEEIIETENGVIMRCVIGFLAEGRGKGMLWWEGVTLRWYAGVDRIAPVDTETLLYADFPGMWANPTMTGQAADSSWWVFSGGAPFEVEAVYKYKLDLLGPSDTVNSGRVRCGPLPSAAAAPPTVRITSIVTSDPVVEVGDTITVNYTASAPGGLWEMGVALDGPFTAIRAHRGDQSTSLSFSDKFVVPGRIPSGPLTVIAFAGDVLMQVDDTATTPFEIVDVSPPVVTVNFTPRQLAADDAVILDLSATDGNGLGWLVYEFGPPGVFRDSIQLGGTRVDRELVFIPPSSLINTEPELRVSVLDVAGVRSVVRASPPGTYWMYPTLSGPGPVASATLSGEVQHIAIDTPRGLAYVYDPGPGRMVALDLATMTPAWTVTMPSPASHFDLTASGDSLLIVHALTGYLSVIDLESRTLLAPLQIPGWLDISGGNTISVNPAGIAVTQSGHALVILENPGTQGRQILDLDLATKAGVWRTDFQRMNAQSEYWRFFAATPDRSRIHIVQRPCARVYSVSSDAFSSCDNRAVDSNHSHIAFDALGQRYAIGQRLYGPGATAEWLIPGHSITFADDGQTFWSLDGGGIRLLRSSDLRILRRTTLPDEGPMPRVILKLPGQPYALVTIGNWIAKYDLTAF